MRFISDFPSGNGKLIEAREVLRGTQKIWEVTFLAESRAGEPRPLWFYFRLEDLDGDLVRIRFANSAVCLGDESGWTTNRPVYRTECTDWTRVPAAENERDVHHVLQTWYELPVQGVWLEFAFCYPYPQAQLLKTVEDCGIFHPSVIGYSNHGRLIYRFATDEGESGGQKPGFLFLARLHAGEVTASWEMDGMMRYLASPAGKALREKFLWWFIPLADIDGVEEGYYGKDQKQGDLNRSFGSWFTHRVEVTAVQDCILQMKGCCQLQLMLDMHSPGHDETESYFVVHGETTDAHRDALRILWSALNRNLKACEMQEVLFDEKPIGNNTSSQTGLCSYDFTDLIGVNGCSFECNYQGERDHRRFYTVRDYRRLGECMLKAIAEVYSEA